MGQLSRSFLSLEHPVTPDKTGPTPPPKISLNKYLKLGMRNPTQDAQDANEDVVWMFKPTGSQILNLHFASVAAVGENISTYFKNILTLSNYTGLKQTNIPRKNVAWKDYLFPFLK